MRCNTNSWATSLIWVLMLIIIMPQAHGQSGDLRDVTIRLRLDSALAKALTHQDQPKQFLQQLHQIRELTKDVAYDSLLFAAWLADAHYHFQHQSFKYALKAYQIADSLGRDFDNVINQAHIKSQIGLIYLENKKYDQAKNYFNKALEIFEKQNDLNGEFIQLINLGKLYQDLGEYKDALIILEEALYLKAEHGKTATHTALYYELGNTYLALAQKHKALEAAQTALDLANTFEQKAYVLKTYLLLSDIYERFNEHKFSKAFLRKYIAHQDSSNEHLVRLEIAKIEHQLEGDRRTKIIEDLEKESDQQRIRRNSIISILVIILLASVLISIIIYRNTVYQKKNNIILNEKNTLILDQQQEILEANKKLKEKNNEILEANKKIDEYNTQLEKINVFLESKIKRRTKKLSKANQDLKVANEELELMTYRVSHDFKSPLSTIDGLVNLIAIQFSDEALSQYLNQIGQTTALMNRMLEKLVETHYINSYHQDDGSFTELLNVKKEIRNQINMYQDLKKSNIVFKDFNGKIIGVNERIVFIFLKNIIENALVFRCYDRESKCEVRFDVSDEKKMIFSIFDNGSGIPNHLIHKVTNMFFRGTSASKGNGLGLYIARKAVERLGGAMEIRSEENTFTEVLISFPVGTTGMVYEPEAQ